MQKPGFLPRATPLQRNVTRSERRELESDTFTKHKQRAMGGKPRATPSRKPMVLVQSGTFALDRHGKQKPMVWVESDTFTKECDARVQNGSFCRQRHLHITSAKRGFWSTATPLQNTSEGRGAGRGFGRETSSVGSKPWSRQKPVWKVGPRRGTRRARVSEID